MQWTTFSPLLQDAMDNVLPSSSGCNRQYSPLFLRMQWTTFSPFFRVQWTTFLPLLQGAIDNVLPSSSVCNGQRSSLFFMVQWTMFSPLLQGTMDNNVVHCILKTLYPEEEGRPLKIWKKRVKEKDKENGLMHQDYETM